MLVTGCDVPDENLVVLWKILFDMRPMYLPCRLRRLQLAFADESYRADHCHPNHPPQGATFRWYSQALSFHLPNTAGPKMRRAACMHRFFSFSSCSTVRFGLRGSYPRRPNSTRAFSSSSSMSSCTFLAFLCAAIMFCAAA